MPRKNSRVRSRRSLAYKFWDQDAPLVPSYIPTPLDKIVIPDGKCTLQRRQKDRYDTQEKAEQAKKRMNRALGNFPESRKIKRVYKCPEETCGGWHLTSREEFDEEQARMIYERKNHINEEKAS